jgi:hypothetical protein
LVQAKPAIKIVSKLAVTRAPSAGTDTTSTVKVAVDVADGPDVSSLDVSAAVVLVVVSARVLVAAADVVVAIAVVVAAAVETVAVGVAVDMAGVVVLPIPALVDVAAVAFDAAVVLTAAEVALTPTVVAVGVAVAAVVAFVAAVVVIVVVVVVVVVVAAVVVVVVVGHGVVLHIAVSERLGHSVPPFRWNRVTVRVRVDVPFGVSPGPIVPPLEAHDSEHSENVDHSLTVHGTGKPQ